VETARGMMAASFFLKMPQFTMFERFRNHKSLDFLVCIGLDAATTKYVNCWRCSLGGPRSSPQGVGGKKRLD
jgi:hypothetical protein